MQARDIVGALKKRLPIILFVIVMTIAAVRGGCKGGTVIENPSEYLVCYKYNDSQYLIVEKQLMRNSKGDTNPIEYFIQIKDENLVLSKHPIYISQGGTIEFGSENTGFYQELVEVENTIELVSIDRHTGERIRLRKVGQDCNSVMRTPAD